MVAGSACVMAVHIGSGMGFVEVKGLWQHEKLLASPPHNHEIQKSIPNLLCTVSTN
jgi:hypothetical protein